MSASRPFRFACRATGRPDRTRQEWERMALTAEALGYDTFAVADHFGTRYAPLLVLQVGRGGISYVTVPSDRIDEFAPVLDLLRRR